MPFSDPVPRREIHHRCIDMKAYAREDGLYDVEAHLVDRKPFPFTRLSSPEPVPAGQALHDLRVRFTVDEHYVVRAIEASADATPYAMCREAELTLAVLIGERIARGWSALVKERLKGAASCTHLKEVLIPMATTAMQGIQALHRKSGAAVDASGGDKVDSCYAYGRQRENVQRLWPHLYRPKEGG